MLGSLASGTNIPQASGSMLPRSNFLPRLPANTAVSTLFHIVAELGHNFGSEHDVQDDRTCSPTSGGKFIMYPASVSGQKANNNVSSAHACQTLRTMNYGPA